MDPRVLDVNALLRWFLVNVMIVPRRAHQSAHAYQKIWTAHGSPLLVHGRALTHQLQTLVGSEIPVVLGMRYQSPSIPAALAQLRAAAVTRVIVFPLFPQYSESAWASAMESVTREAARFWNLPALHIIPPYFDHPAFINAFANVAQRTLAAKSFDHVLMSFHGLPERHLRKSERTPGAHCLKNTTCCETISAQNRYCYRAQCVATARALAAQLQLPRDRYSISFQSRLGRDPWIHPYTDEVIHQLVRTGCKRLAVLCPAFTADCLETLEEIAMRLRDDFLKAGGEALQLIPSLNSEPVWAEAMVSIMRLEAGG